MFSLTRKIHLLLMMVLICCFLEIQHSKLYAQEIKIITEFTSSNLPIIVINTNGQTIPNDDPRIIADMGIINNSDGNRNFLTDQHNDYDGKISIEIRGESSASWDNKSYSIETQNEDGTDNDVSLLGLPEENDWVLYTPYYDRSLMRNSITFHLSREMGHYASRTVYCELVLNGEYRGIYILMEKIKRDKNRVPIAKLEPEEVSGDDLTGGYLLRVDKEPWKAGFDSEYPPFPGSNYTVRYQYRYPDDDDIVPEQEQYIQAFINEFETIMYSGDYSDSVEGYEKYLDVESFIDYIIINELSRNVDGYRLSAYMYKDKDSDGGKLHAGPVWDYNFSYGNVDYHNSWLIEGWQLLFFADDKNFREIEYYHMPFWWKTLFLDESFSERFNERWNNLRNNVLNKDTLFSFVDSLVVLTAEARERNFEIWPGPGETDLGGGWYPNDPRSSFINSYEDEISLTKQWISDRIDWIDDNISLITDINRQPQNEIPNQFELKQNYPNPFNPSTVIEFSVPKAGIYSIVVYDVIGKKVELVTKKEFDIGFHKIIFDASSLSAGVYVYQLSGNKINISNKMILLK